MNLYSTTSLLGVVSALDRPSTWLLDQFFPVERTFETKEVYYDKAERARRMALFVAPSVAGKIMRNEGFTTDTFAPAYVKPKHSVEPEKAFDRAIGEGIGGTEMSPEQRFNMAVAKNLQREEEYISRTETWMASELVRTGAVTVTGEDFPTMLVDLGRDAALSDTLLSTARWGETGVGVMSYIRGRAAVVAAKSGAAARRVVMDPLAALIFQQDDEVREVLDNRRQNSGNFELSGLQGGGDGAQGEEAVYLGSIGQFDFYQYQEIYTDAAGTEHNMFPDYTVVVASPTQAEGRRCYGAIKDTKAQLKAMARFPKMWDENDPPTTFTMTQSAPLPLLGRPNAISCSTVR